MDQIYHGDCLDIMATFEPGFVDMIYLDPPFFTGKRHTLSDRTGRASFGFDDMWQDHKAYADFLHPRLQQMHTLLADHGALFFHCDRRGQHIVRLLLDDVFGAQHFQSEIIWRYRRWSNSKTKLLPNHQNIYFYTKTKAHTFHTIYTDYSPTTNVEQLLQKRTRDARNKAVYATDEAGVQVPAGPKRGVPLGDVWDIPYLNPKAKERVGYPTQKPIALLERIIALTTSPGDLVLDPFCGSGTTCVAAMLMGRRALGIDSSADAVALSRQRLESPTRAARSSSPGAALTTTRPTETPSPCFRACHFIRSTDTAASTGCSKPSSTGARSCSGSSAAAKTSPSSQQPSPAPPETNKPPSASSSRPRPQTPTSTTTPCAKTASWCSLRLPFSSEGCWGTPLAEHASQQSH